MLPVRVFSFIFKIVALLSYFHFVGSEEKVSCAKRKFVLLCLGILYLAPGISNPYLNFKFCRRKIIPLLPQNYFLWRQTRIYVEIVHNVEIVLLVRNYPAGTSELVTHGVN